MLHKTIEAKAGVAEEGRADDDVVKEYYDNVLGAARKAAEGTAAALGMPESANELRRFEAWAAGYGSEAHAP